MQLVGGTAGPITLTRAHQPHHHADKQIDPHSSAQGRKWFLVYDTLRRSKNNFAMPTETHDAPRVPLVDRNPTPTSTQQCIQHTDRYLARGAPLEKKAHNLYFVHRTGLPLSALDRPTQTRRFTPCTANLPPLQARSVHLSTPSAKTTSLASILYPGGAQSCMTRPRCLTCFYGSSQNARLTPYTKQDPI